MVEFFSTRPFPPGRLAGKTIAIFVADIFEDAEILYPETRLEEEGGLVVGEHGAGHKYTGKIGATVKSDVQIDDLGIVDSPVLPGGYAPDEMRRNAKMLATISSMIGKPVGSHLSRPVCSARLDGRSVVSGYSCTSISSIQDDIVNAGCLSLEPVVVVVVVVDRNVITSRKTPRPSATPSY
ncbi:hypothetical protein CTAYLR_000913 [Chrysophaeum taylorii]|uniref:DJ-1/PfpI domain-containing protein n=1 Tax=Chrysophaeum taylorii TaxID=2483200 RepID=A0AAD7UFA8_9STRA|nr:hypothetical protein CTAYLR_000913 [Chrysophaeum taylorii]